MDSPTDPASVAALVGPARIARVRGTLASRLGSVVCVLEGVRRRHNVSAIVRSCEAFGVHEVHVVTEGWLRPSPGASRAAERWLDLRVSPRVEPVLDELRARGFRVYVADLAAEACTPEEVPVDGPVALVFGSEVRGVGAAARARADGVVCVPMRGLTESLNVSVSAAIVLRTVAERRRARTGPDLAPAAQEAFVADWLAREARALRGRLARTAAPEPAGSG